MDREKAIRICENKLPNKPVFSVTCRECYYYDSRCELGFTKRPQDCYYYVNDAVNTNLVRKNILNNPKWVIDNWNMICDADKKLFFAIYGDNTIIGGSASCGKTERQRLASERIKKILDDGFKVRCPKCGADLPRYPFYDERYEYYHCPNCDYVKRVKSVGVR